MKTKQIVFKGILWIMPILFVLLILVPFTIPVHRYRRQHPLPPADFKPLPAPDIPRVSGFMETSDGVRFFTAPGGFFRLMPGAGTEKPLLEPGSRIGDLTVGEIIDSILDPMTSQAYLLLRMTGPETAASADFQLLTRIDSQSGPNPEKTRGTPLLRLDGKRYHHSMGIMDDYLVQVTTNEIIQNYETTDQPVILNLEFHDLEPQQNRIPLVPIRLNVDNPASRLVFNPNASQFFFSKSKESDREPTRILKRQIDRFEQPVQILSIPGEYRLISMVMNEDRESLVCLSVSETDPGAGRIDFKPIDPESHVEPVTIELDLGEGWRGRIVQAGTGKIYFTGRVGYPKEVRYPWNRNETCRIRDQPYQFLEFGIVYYSLQTGAS
jgi:hypothetical protein